MTDELKACEQIKQFSKTWLDENVWDDENRSGCKYDFFTFTPDNLQKIFDAFIEDAFRRNNILDEVIPKIRALMGGQIVVAGLVNFETIQKAMIE